MWSFDINNDCTRLVAGSGDAFLRVWKLNNPENNTEKSENNNSVKMSNFEYATYMGTLSRPTDQRVLQVGFTKDFLAVLSSKVLQLYLIRTDQEIKKKLNRKLKRKREKDDVEEDESIDTLAVL